MQRKPPAHDIENHYRDIRAYGIRNGIDDLRSTHAPVKKLILMVLKRQSACFGV